MFRQKAKIERSPDCQHAPLLHITCIHDTFRSSQAAPITFICPRQQTPQAPETRVVLIRTTRSSWYRAARRLKSTPAQRSSSAPRQTCVYPSSHTRARTLAWLINPSPPGARERKPVGPRARSRIYIYIIHYVRFSRSQPRSARGDLLCGHAAFYKRAWARHRVRKCVRYDVFLYARARRMPTARVLYVESIVAKLA